MPITVGTEGPDSLVGIANQGFDTVSGLGGDDTIDAAGGYGTFSGGAGDDRIFSSSGAGGAYFGDDGNDTLIGGGDITYTLMDGGPGDDLIETGPGTRSGVGYSSATSGVTVDLRITGPQAIGGGEGTDTLVNIHPLSGSDFGDTVTGTDAADDLRTGGGNDSINADRATTTSSAGKGTTPSAAPAPTAPPTAKTERPDHLHVRRQRSRRRRWRRHADLWRRVQRLSARARQ